MQDNLRTLFVISFQSLKSTIGLHFQRDVERMCRFKFPSTSFNDVTVFSATCLFTEQAPLQLHLSCTPCRDGSNIENLV